MLLQEEASQSHTFSECATEPFGGEEKSLLKTLEALAASQCADEHRLLLMWVIQQLQVVQKQQMGTPVDGEGGREGGEGREGGKGRGGEGDGREGGGGGEERERGEEGVRERVVRGLKWYSPSFAEAMDNPSSAEPAPEQPPETSARAQLAAEKKKKIMEAMALQQRNFLRKHRDEFNSIPSMAGSPTESDRSARTRIQTDSAPHSCQRLHTVLKCTCMRVLLTRAYWHFVCACGPSLLRRSPHLPAARPS